MSFIQRELNRIHPLLLDVHHPQHAELYAAQQALRWAQDPDGFASPYRMLRGTLADSRDYQASLNPSQS
jgi:hypothetical protein